MQELNCYLNNKKTYSITGINYKKINKVNKKADIIVRDYIEVLSINKDGLQLKYKREVVNEPKSNFSLTIESIIKHYFNEDIIEDLEFDNINNENTLIEIMKEPDFYIGIVASDISLLISNITNSAWLFPVITPPYYYEDKLYTE